MKKIETHILLILITVVIACKNNTSIVKHEDLSLSTHNQYITLLEKAKVDEDSFEEGIQLANLKQEPNIVFDKINRGIREKPEQSCLRMYPPYEVYKAINHMTNLVKIDTVQFFNSIKLCSDLLGESHFATYVQKKKVASRERKSNRVKIDSTKLDYELIAQLKQIMINDQESRLKLDNPKYNNDEQVDAWQQQQKKIL